MEYRKPLASSGPRTKIQPRLIIHGGAGNIRRENYPSEKYAAYRSALLTIVSENSFSGVNSNTNSAPLSQVKSCTIVYFIILLCV